MGNVRMSRLQAFAARVLRPAKTGQRLRRRGAAAFAFGHDAGADYC
jgi:hypothetical protein